MNGSSCWFTSSPASGGVFYVDYACRYVVDFFQYSLKTLNFISFYVYGTFACMYNCVSLVCLVHVEVEEGRRASGSNVGAETWTSVL